MRNLAKLKNNITIPSNDGVEIVKVMLSRAKAFYICLFDMDSDFKLIKKRPNPYAKKMQPLKTLDFIKKSKIAVSSSHQKLAKKEFTGWNNAMFARVK